MDFINENIELSGKFAFEIFLDIISDFDLLFIKQDYLNTADYSYFFTTERMKTVREIIDVLQRKKSLKTAYLTLGKIQDMRLSFFFGVKGYTLFYGYYNEDNRYVYKVGKFRVTPKDLRNFAKLKCFRTIRSILSNNNLKNLKYLQVVKVDFHTLFDGVEPDVEIVDEYIVKNTYPIDVLKEEDRVENKLALYLQQWSRNFSWTDKNWYYVRLTEKYVHFYIKIKS